MRDEKYLKKKMKTTIIKKAQRLKSLFYYCICKKTN